MCTHIREMLPEDRERSHVPIDPEDARDHPKITSRCFTSCSSLFVSFFIFFTVHAFREGILCVGTGPIIEISRERAIRAGLYYALTLVSFSWWRSVWYAFYVIISSAEIFSPFLCLRVIYYCNGFLMRDNGYDVFFCKIIKQTIVVLCFNVPLR